MPTRERDRYLSRRRFLGLGAAVAVASLLGGVARAQGERPTASLSANRSLGQLGHRGLEQFGQPFAGLKSSRQSGDWSLTGVDSGLQSAVSLTPLESTSTQGAVRGRSSLAPAGLSSIKGESLTFAAEHFGQGQRVSLRLGSQGLSLVDEAAGLYTSPVIAAPLPFTSVGPHWAGDLPASSEVSVQVRTSADAKVWSPWQTVELETPFGSTKAPKWFGSLVSASSPGETDRYAQFRVRLAKAASGLAEVPLLSQMTLTFIDSSAGPTTEEGLRMQSANPVQPAVVLPAAVAMPPTLWRVNWGCPEGESSPGWPPEYRAVTHLAIHHTASSNGISNWAAHVRDIWYYHAVTLDWGDIGYNYLVDPNGVVYEGRAGGNDVCAAHVYGFNTSGTMGVAALGTYSSVGVSSSLQSSLEGVLAWKCSLAGLDPAGYRSITGYTSCSPLTVNHPVISGHRDFPGHNWSNRHECNPYGTTACPGDRLEAILPSVRGNVVLRVQASVPQPFKAFLPLVRR